MSSQVSITTEMKTRDKNIILLKQVTETEYFHNEIYKALGINSNHFNQIITKYKYCSDP